MPNRLKGSVRSVLLSSISIVSVFSTASFAQDSLSSEDNEFLFEEIVVLGEKRGRSVQDTISSLSITTGEQIEKATIDTVQDILKRTAGVSSAADFSFSIRGINSEGQNGTGSSLASIYIDGAVLATQAAARGGPLSVWDVAQVEIFRGSQSTSQGRNALAGAIVIKTADPTFEWEGKAQASYGNLDTYRLSAAVGGPLIEDTLAFRVSIDKTSTDGDSTNVTLGLDDWALEDNFLARGKLLWQSNSVEGLSAKLTGIYSDSEFGTKEVNVFADPVNEIQPVDPFDRLAFSNTRDMIETDVQGVIFELNYDDIFEGVDLVSITAYTDTKQDQVFDQDFDAAGPDTGTTQLVEDESFSQELRLSYDQGGAFSGLFGFYYFNSDSTTELENVLGVPLAPFIPLFPPQVQPLVPDILSLDVFSRDEVSTENYAFFFEGDYDLSDSWQVTAGLRYDRESQDLSLTTTTVPDSSFPAILLPAVLPLLPPNLNGDGGENTYTAWLPSFAVTHRINDDVSASVSVKRAYRAGGTDFNIARSTRVFYDPEYTWTYEFALRSVWLDGRMTANANVYYTDWTDQQVDVQLSNTSRFDRQTENAGESHLYGAELEINATVSEEFDVFASASYSKTVFDEFTSSAGDLSGNEFRYAPKWRLVAGGTYKHESGFTANMDATYTSSSFDNARNDPILDGLDSRVVVNGKIGYETDNYGIYLYGRNILDEKYFRNIGRGVVILGDPATYGVQVKVGF